MNTQSSGNCTRGFLARCQLGDIVSVGSIIEQDGEGGDQLVEVTGVVDSCVPIDCGKGDVCGEGSGGVCSLSKLSGIDPLAILPISYIGGM
jgi:hypothetical protein